MDTAAFVKQIGKLPGYQGQVVHVERLRARRARYGKLEQPLPPGLQAALFRKLDESVIDEEYARLEG